MGADTKALRTRIKSVDSTLHLTKAMGLVAASKIRKATDRMNKAREYSDVLTESINTLLGSKEAQRSPYVATHNGNRTKIIVIAGDRGLAGGYNSNVFKVIQEYPEAELISIGKRAGDRYGDTQIVCESFTYNDCLGLARSLCRDFKENKFDRLICVHTNYISVLTQEAAADEILPVKGNAETKNSGMIFEPDELTVLNELIPEYVAGKIYAYLRESFACEQAARRNAMDSAGKNAEQMIADLQLQYNRARQGAITQEITEIVAGT